MIACWRGAFTDFACLSEMERRNDSGSDNMVFSVFYGTNLLVCREAKPGRVIPGRGIIGTAQGQAVEPERLTVSGWTW